MASLFHQRLEVAQSLAGLILLKKIIKDGWKFPNTPGYHIANILYIRGRVVIISLQRI